MSATGTPAGIGHGDFSSLAAGYARFRPGYAPEVATSVIARAGKEPAQIDAVDIGAGTGIWTRMLCAHGLHSVIAVEPNDEMRAWGRQSSGNAGILWLKGSAEATGLPDASADLVTMASSLHWADFDQACDEFARTLKPGGVFAALWNPRLIEENPLLVEIEEEISRLQPGIRRVSSGRSGLAERLAELLKSKPAFAEVQYIEGRHTVQQTPEDYIGLWRSVNDLQVQMGPELFGRFLDFVADRTAGIGAIETTYLTRAWAAKRV